MIKIVNGKFKGRMKKTLTEMLGEGYVEYVNDCIQTDSKTEYSLEKMIQLNSSYSWSMFIFEELSTNTNPLEFKFTYWIKCKNPEDETMIMLKV